MNLSRKFLAGAILALLPLTGALACNTAAWNGGATGNPIADDPDTHASTNATETAAVKRYSGKCGLQSAAGGNSFVTDNSPTGDGGGATPYRARFYVYTSPTAAAKVFSAGDADNGGNELLSVTYNPGASFVATAPGGATATVNGIAANRWYMVEIKYQNGTPLDLFVRGNGGTAANSAEQTASSAGNAGPGGVGSARIGVIGATTGTVAVDEFDSSRGATRIGGLLRGDAAASDGVGAPDASCNAGDAIAMVAEFFTLNGIPPGTNSRLAPGQPDCDEDGTTNANDVQCLVNRFFAQAGNQQPCGGA